MWPLWEGGTEAYINGPGHMTKMVAKSIYAKTLKIFYSGSEGPLILKLVMEHRGLKFYKVLVYIIDDPGRLILTYFTARSKSVAYVFKQGKL